MITVIYCTKEHNPEHTEHIKKLSGSRDIEVIEYINNNEGLTKPYNKCLTEAKYDIVVFMHDDVEIMTKNFAKKVVKHQERCTVEYITRTKGKLGCQVTVQTKIID